MFEDSLLESGGRLKTKRGRTTTVAIFLEIIAIGIMVLLPLIFTEALPKQMTRSFLVAPRLRHLRHLRLLLPLKS